MRLHHSLKRRGHDLRWYWVREISLRGEGVDNTHIHAHDPFADDGKTFERLLMRAFAPDGGPIDGGLLIKPVGTGQRGSGGPMGWWRYCFKGLRRTDGSVRYIRPRAQGSITGKRSGMTENINRAARARASKARQQTRAEAAE